MGIIEAIPQIITELIKNMPEIISSIVEGLKDGISSIKEIGGDLIRGLWEGIKDMAGWIKKKIKGFGEGVLDDLKNFFCISSPSKLIEKEVGVNVGKAVVPNRPSALAKVKKQLNKFSEFVSANIGDIKAGLSLDNGQTGSGSNGYSGRSTVVDARMTVHYNGKMSRKQLKQTENNHYNSVKMKLKAEGAI